MIKVDFPHSGFSPAFKVSRKVTEKTSLNIECYVDLGDVNKMSNQGQETYLTQIPKFSGMTLISALVAVGQGQIIGQ